MSCSEDDCGDDLYCDLPEVRNHPFHCRSSQNDSESHSVAAHYNARPNVEPAQRSRSAIIHLRDFNNWTKSVLIREFVSQRNLKVLDLACGKGGDLFKWDKASVSHVTGIGTRVNVNCLLMCLDIAQVSVDHAKERYQSMRGVSFEAKFIAYDAFHVIQITLITHYSLLTCVETVL